MRACAKRLLLEELEDRCVPTVWGTPWPDAGHPTGSFAPDGTQVGDHRSNLFQARPDPVLVPRLLLLPRRQAPVPPSAAERRHRQQSQISPFSLTGN